MARLTEEVGELAREVNHYYGEKQKKSRRKTKDSIRGTWRCLFVLISMANSLEIDLTEVFLKKNMAKFNKRDRYRFERKDGKNT